MEVLVFLKEYWFLITFLGGFVVYIYNQVKSQREATKCSLRNDILEIYDRCKDTKKITHYQLEAIQHSAEIYFRLKGNSFVKDVVERVKQFDLVD